MRLSPQGKVEHRLIFGLLIFHNLVIPGLDERTVKLVTVSATNPALHLDSSLKTSTSQLCTSECIFCMHITLENDSVCVHYDVRRTVGECIQCGAVKCRAVCDDLCVQAVALALILFAVGDLDLVHVLRGADMKHVRAGILGGHGEIQKGRQREKGDRKKGKEEREGG